MKKLKKISDHILRFYRKAKKKIVRKIMIVATCLVCAFSPIYSSYKEVNAIVGIDDAVVVSGVMSVLALLGIGISSAGADNLTDTCYDIADGFSRFGETLVGTVKDKFDTLMNGIMYTGSVVLDAFNTIGSELGHAMYDIFNTSNGNSYVGDLELADGVRDFVTFGDDMNFFYSPGNPLNNPCFDALFAGFSGLCIVTSNGTYISSLPDDYNDVNNGVVTKNQLSCLNIVFQPSWLITKFQIYSLTSHTTNTINSDVGFNKYDREGILQGSQSKIYFKDILFASFFGTFYSINYDSVSAFHLGNKWVKSNDLTLELDPPWVTNKGTNTDLTLLDDSYINYGDIDDIAIPRYVAPDATYTPEGVIDYPGSWSIPNQYTPNLDRPVPVPLPFPLPDIGTIPNDYTGDITKDTPIENTDEDADIDDPDYVIPTVGDFLGDYDVPGKLNWKEYFPFCIPFDLIKFIGCLAAEPEAPNFKWDYEILGTKGTVKVDLKEYESVALVARTLFDLLFVLGLTMVTRNLIKG